MCECGCVSGDTVYRLPVDDASCYVVRLRQGCRNCAGPPTVIIERITPAAVHWREIQEAPLLPLSPVYEWTEATILSGLVPDEFRAEVRKVAAESFDDDIDDVTADDLADEVWDAALGKPPRVLEYKAG